MYIIYFKNGDSQRVSMEEISELNSAANIVSIVDEETGETVFAPKW